MGNDLGTSRAVRRVQGSGAAWALTCLALVATYGCAASGRPTTDAHRGTMAQDAGSEGRSSRGQALSGTSLTNIASTPITDTANAPGLAYTFGDEDNYLERGSDGKIRGRVTMSTGAGGTGPRILAKMINATLGTEIDIVIESGEVGSRALLGATTGGVVIRGHPDPRPASDSGGGTYVDDDHALLTTPYLIKINQRTQRPHVSVFKHNMRATAAESVGRVMGNYPMPSSAPGSVRLTSQQAKLWVNLIAYAINASGRGLVHAAAQSGGTAADPSAPGFLETLTTTRKIGSR